MVSSIFRITTELSKFCEWKRAIHERICFFQPQTEGSGCWTELKSQQGSRKVRNHCEPVTITNHHKRNSWWYINRVSLRGFCTNSRRLFWAFLMALSNAVISIVSVAAVVLCSLMLCFDCKPTAVQGLRLENYSEQQVKGCYDYNQTLSICFDVGKDFMKLATKTGEEIVFHLELGPNMFYCNVLGQGFIGWV